MGDSQYQQRLDIIAEKEQQLKLVNTQIEGFGREKADEEIETTKIEAKIKTEERRNPFVAQVKKELRSKEGKELTAYKPVDSEEYFTIGYGHYGADVEEGMVITEERAEELLHEDVMERVDSINNIIPKFEEMPKELKIAIFSEHFRGSIAQSKNTLRLINEGKFAEAADEFLNNDEYKNARRLGKSGIRPRMEAVANNLREYDKLLYPEKYKNQNNNSLLSRVTDIFN